MVSHLRRMLYSRVRGADVFPKQYLKRMHTFIYTAGQGGLLLRDSLEKAGKHSRVAYENGWIVYVAFGEPFLR